MRAPTALRLLLCLALVAATAAADDLALTRDGVLVRVAQDETGLSVSSRLPDGSSLASLVPQTAGVEIAFAQVVVDESTGVPFVVWQEGEVGATRIVLASWHEGTWIGPIVVAGGDGTIASNPDVIVSREKATFTETDEDGVETPYQIETTFVHLAWWSQRNADDAGAAVYLAVPVDATGVADLAAATELPLVDLLPYGIGCSDITDAGHLNFPKLLLDPSSGKVNAMALDLTNCLFQVVEMDSEVVDWDSVAKRGRHSIIVGRTTMMALNPEVPLGDADMKVGRNLSLVLYWDVEQAVAYTMVDEGGWSAVKTLPYGAGTGLDHEQAVDLVQGLTR